ncbi:MAG: diacylglycerol kinase family lipid kinase [Bacteroidales bacterium]|nr:diacylglycerol kinase family lipid kinase [Bacteroidales bacterium]
MPRKITFIVNPISGQNDKSQVLSAIGKHLDLSLYQPQILFTSCAGEAYEMARTSEAEVVVAVGGDGTVSEVARGLVGTEKCLGIIPCGSGDGLALHLGISRLPFLAVETLNKGCEARIDVARMNGQPFFCTAGFGLDAQVSMEFARSTKRGLPRYISLAWEEWKQHSLAQYAIRSEKGMLWEGKAVFVTVANANQWGNQARIAPMASLQDGLLDVVVVNPFSTLEIPDLATRLMTGRAPTSRHFLHFRGNHFYIWRSDNGPVHFDGDPFEAGTSFDLDVQPAALKVMVPRSKSKRI